MWMMLKAAPFVLAWKLLLTLPFPMIWRVIPAGAQGPQGPVGPPGPSGGGTAPQIQVFTANGTFTTPVNAKAIDVYIWGGGGGGGGGDSVANGNGTGGGGGAGGHSRKLITAPAASYAVVIGGGGGGGGATVAGGNGVASTFGAVLTANPGLGGGGGCRCTLIPSTPSSRSFLEAAVACAASAISGAENLKVPIILQIVSEGSAFGATSASPVERIFGPSTSPDSMRSRSRRVFSHWDPVSKTLVKP